MKYKYILSLKVWQLFSQPMVHYTDSLKMDNYVLQINFLNNFELHNLFCFCAIQDHTLCKLTNNWIPDGYITDTRSCLCDNTRHFISNYVPTTRTLLVHVWENLDQWQMFLQLQFFNKFHWTTSTCLPTKHLSRIH